MGIEATFSKHGWAKRYRKRQHMKSFAHHGEHYSETLTLVYLAIGLYPKNDRTDDLRLILTFVIVTTLHLIASFFASEKLLEYKEAPGSI